MIKIDKKVVRKIIQETIQAQLLLEKDLDYLNPMLLFKDRNPKIKEFKTIVFERLQPYYTENPSVEFLGTIPRHVARIVKQVYNDPSSALVDRNFLQNDVRKLHYLDIRQLEDFINKAPNNSKHEISTVGYIPGEQHTNPLRASSSASIAVQLEGFVTFAGNKNLVTGKVPTSKELEAFKSSGVPKLHYMEPDSTLPQHPTALAMIPLMVMNLTNHINVFLNAAVLDRETFSTALQRKKSSKVAPWNEFVLDNWNIKSLVIASKNFENLMMLEKIAKKYNLPVLEISEL
jgi:hypothetical protein